jgi:hypothetical protein
MLRMRNYCWLLVLLLQLILINSASSDPSHKPMACSSRHSCEQILLVYSQDDSICKPLLNMYQRLADLNNQDAEYINRSSEHPSDKWDWENVYSKVFSQSGFREPTHLNDMHHRIQEGAGAKLYKLRLDSKVGEQVVLLEDYPFHAHGDYSTDVYISRPNEDIEIQCSLDDFDYLNYTAYVTEPKSTNPDIESACAGKEMTHNKLAFATAFLVPINKSHIDASVVVEGKYPLSKIGQSLTAPITQRLYLFKKRSIFTLRDRSDNAVAYEIKGGNKMADVCYFKSTFTK